MHVGVDQRHVRAGLVVRVAADLAAEHQRHGAEVVVGEVLVDERADRLLGACRPRSRRPCCTAIRRTPCSSSARMAVSVLGVGRALGQRTMFSRRDQPADRRARAVAVELVAGALAHQQADPRALALGDDVGRDRRRPADHRDLREQRGRGRRSPSCSRALLQALEEADREVVRGRVDLDRRDRRAVGEQAVGQRASDVDVHRVRPRARARARSPPAPPGLPCSSSLLSTGLPRSNAPACGSSRTGVRIRGVELVQESEAHAARRSRPRARC